MSAGQPPLDSPEIRRLTPVIGPGYTYGSVTDKISAIVLTRPTSLGWYIGFLIAFSLMGLWPQFRSPLIWDVFAVSTYGTVSLMFWFVGLIPDLATLRDRSIRKPMKIIYGMLSMGWRGSARHWHRYQSAYLLLAGLATPLVLSVHSVVSFDFSVAIVPRWHTTGFPPYFVACAVYSGVPLAFTLSLPLRRVYGL